MIKDEIWRSGFHNKASEKDRMQDIPLNKLKFKVKDTYKKDEKITTNFNTSNPEDVINKGFLQTKIAELNGHISYVEKHYNEFRDFQDPSSKLIRSF